MKYEDALTELQSIIQAIEEDEVSIDDLVHKVQRAKELLQFCQAKLRDIGTEMEELLAD